MINVTLTECEAETLLFVLRNYSFTESTGLTAKCYVVRSDAPECRPCQRINHKVRDAYRQHIMESEND